MIDQEACYGGGLGDKQFANLLRHVGRLEEEDRTNGIRRLPYWYNERPAARRLPRRPAAYFPKKSSWRGWEMSAGKRVMHPIWFWYHSWLRKGGCAKLCRPYKMPLTEEACPLTSEDLADVKEMIEEIDHYNAAKRRAK